MSYRVFARKYRPQRFQEVVGQLSIIQTLQNAISLQKLAQAYLFVGPRGVGKTSIARIFAKALNCHEGPTVNPCGVCAACVEIAEGHSMDVLEIDGASNNSVESIRTLRENAAFAPARGPYKIYLIDEVHMLTTAAFNALLKTLEEPPEHVKFIFATTEAQKLPATITSRCQRFDLRRLTEKEISEHLLYIASQEKITLSSEAALAVAHGADGALRDAESMLDQLAAFCGTSISELDVQHIFGFSPSDLVHQLGTAILTLDVHASLAILQEQSDAGKDLSRLFHDLIRFFRDLLIEIVHPAVESTRFSLLRDHVSAEKLLHLLEDLGKAEERFRWASDKKLQCDVTVIKAIHLLQEVSLSDVLDVLTNIAKGGPLPVPKPLPPSLKPLRAATPKQPSLEKVKVPQVTLIDIKASLAATPALAATKNLPPQKEAELLPNPLPKQTEAAQKNHRLEASTPQDRVESDLLFQAEEEVQSALLSEQQSHEALPKNAPEKQELPLPQESQQIPEKLPELSEEILLPKKLDPWTPIATTLAAESPLKFGWLASGRFLERKEHHMVVEFPSSYEAQTETLFWPQARKKIQECLSKNLGATMELVALFTGEEVHEDSFHEEILVAEPPREEPKKTTPSTPPKNTPEAATPKSNAAPVLSAEELELFKNDPLIKKALELFQAEIVRG